MRRNPTLLLATLAVLLCSCQRRDMFVIDEGIHLQMELLRNAAFVDTTLIRTPEVLTVHFYDKTSGRSTVTDYLAPPCATAYVPQGSYDCMAYNFATEYNIVENADDRDKAYVHTSLSGSNLLARFSKIIQIAKQSTLTKADGGDGDGYDYSDLEDIPLINQPEYFWVGRGSYDIPFRNAASPDLYLDIRGSIATVNGRIRIKQVGGAQYVGGVQIYLTNIAGGMYLWSGEPVYDPAAICVDASVDKVNSEINAVFTAFGKLPDGEQEAEGLTNDLFVLVADTGGKQYLYHYDVTEDVSESINLEIDIVVEVPEIDIPEPEPTPGGGGGFTPTVGEWEEEIIPINL